MFKFSVLRPSMFLLLAFFLGQNSALAWNPDYAYGLPKKRRMCVRREGPNNILFYSIYTNEDCPTPAKRYIVVFGKDPRGSMALMRSTTSQRFYPPLTLQWPTDNNPSRTRLWHFTCVKLNEKDVLGSKVELYQYLGEVTSDGKQECFEAEERALTYCKTQLKGESLLENCPISSGR